MLYKRCADGLIRRYNPQDEVQDVLKHCYSLDVGGHFGASKTASKVLQSDFWWPTLFKNVREFLLICDRCQRMGNISKKHEMPLKWILEVELFDVWSIDFMGPILSSLGYKYILVMVDYISKCVEAMPTITNDTRVVKKMLKKVIFLRFGTPRALISDGGSHFCSKVIEVLLKKYGVRHKVATMSIDVP